MPVTLSSDPFQASRTARCWICDAQLSRLQQTQKEQLCSERCRWQYRALPHDQRCVVCGRPLLPRQMAARVCDSIACRFQIDEDAREHERQRRLARERQLRRIRHRKATELRRRNDALPIYAPELYPLAVIPAFRQAVTELPESRRRGIADTLDRVIGEAGAREAPDAAEDESPGGGAPIPPPPALQPLLAGACALCQGHCCRNGGEHAYLTADTILRYMGRHPELSPGEVRTAYLERVGDRTFEGSCVYHGAEGCTLPREMRSHTCNRFFCPELREFQARWREGEPARAFVASMDGEAVVGAAFIDERGPTPVAGSPAA